MYCYDNPSSWADHLAKVEMFMNASPSASTQFTPHYVVYGREMNLPLDLAVADNVPAVKESLDNF